MSDFLVEGHYYNDRSFLMSYSEEEMEWIRNGGEIPKSVIGGSDIGFDIDLDYLEDLDSQGYSKGELPGYRISATSDYSYLGDYKSLGSLKKYIWSEFTDVLLV